MSVKWGAKKFGTFKWGESAGGGKTNSLVFEWDDNIYWLYNRYYVLKSGYLSVSPNITDLYVYVDGTLSGLDTRALELQLSYDEPVSQDVQATEIFLASSIKTDTDGSITGIRGRKYVNTKFYPLTINAVETDTVDTKNSASIITNTDKINLGYNQTPVYVEINYTYKYEFVILGVIETDNNEIIAIKRNGLYGIDGDAQLNTLNIETFGGEVYIRNSQNLTVANKEQIAYLLSLLKPVHIKLLLFFESYGGKSFYTYI